VKIRLSIFSQRLFIYYDKNTIDKVIKDCDENNIESCYNLGNYYNSTGIKNDRIKAQNIFIKAYNGGNLNAGFELGLQYLIGVETKPNVFKGANLLAVTCDKGYAQSCSILGRYYRLGMTVEQNTPKAKIFYSKACKLGDAESCKKKEYDCITDDDYLTKPKCLAIACNLNHSGSCYTLAIFYYAGRGVKQNINTARNLYCKACFDSTFFIGCNECSSLSKDLNNPDALMRLNRFNKLGY